MEPMTMLALSSMAGLGGGIFGNILGGEDRRRAEEMFGKAVSEYENLTLPDLLKRIEYINYQTGGQLTPELLTKLAEESEAPVQLAEEDQAVRDMQVSALNQMAQLGKTGMGIEDMVALEQARRASSGEAEARLQSLKQDMRQRGLGGGGAELATALQTAQAADDRMAQQAMQVAANASQARRGALAQQMSGANDLRSADYRVNQYNTEAQRQNQEMRLRNSQARQSANALARNRANEFNITRQQQVGDKNIGQVNEERYRLGYLAPQQMFANQMSKAQGLSNAYQARGNQFQNQAGATAQNWANIGSGLGNVGMGFAQMQNNNNNFDKLVASNKSVPMTDYGTEMENLRNKSIFGK